MIFSKGEPLKKVPTDQLVDELFKEIDRYYASGKTVVRDEREGNYHPTGELPVVTTDGEA